MSISSGTSSVYDAFLFFFQAEDGIRDVAVTGVQTCALPISRGKADGENRSSAPRHAVFHDYRCAAAAQENSCLCGLIRYARRNENFVLVSGEAASTADAILTPDFLDSQIP